MSTARTGLVIVSNRLPVKLERTDGGWACEPTTGGLVSALAGIRNDLPFQWVGWPGTSVPAEEQPEVRTLLREKLQYEPVFLNDAEIDQFYGGFCNSVLWPLFHYFPDRVDFTLPFWEEYRHVNERFADAVLAVAQPDSLLWVHDYHLFLVPELLRERGSAHRIGFFLHIPFPVSELYRLLPVRREILKGILGADLVGFHTHDYCNSFAHSCFRILGVEPSPTELHWERRQVGMGAYAIGINWKQFLGELKSEVVAERRGALHKQYADVRLILGVDRNDYIKGIPHKLRAYETLLECHPEWRGHVVLLQILIPSRMKVRDYQSLKSEIDELVGRINGRFGTPEFTPIQYVAREVPFDELCALYERADVLAVTSVRDGMNLVALEYAACQRERHGVLVLSEFAGVARSLPGSLLVNPWDAPATADALHEALSMDLPDRARRALQNFTYVRNFHSLAWAERFVRDLRTGIVAEAHPPVDLQNEFFTLRREFLRAGSRLILLDYDGTLVPFSATPEQAAPPPEVLDLLSALARPSRNNVYLVSGRPTADLDRWFKRLGIGLAAEHGLYVKHGGERRWRERGVVSTDWMASVEQVLKDHVRRTPGSSLERKTAGLAFHYREADEKFGEWQALELMALLDATLSNLPVSVLQGNKVIELRPQNIDKGALAQEILADKPEPPDFILALGDDRTDEDMFAALPPHAWTCRVGKSAPTRARYFLEAPAEVLEVLGELADLG